MNCGGGKNAGDPETWADLDGSMTVGAWIKGDTGYLWTKLSTVISKGIGDFSAGGFSMNRKHESTNIAFTVAVPGGLPYDGLGGGDPNIWDEWHHVTGVYSTADSPDANGVWIYIDGVESGYFKRWSEPVRLNNFDVFIGGNAQLLEKGYRHWYGLIDDVAIFDRALSANEIYQLYTQGALSIDPVLQKLIDTIQEAEAIARKQGHQEVRAFLEERIAEYEKWKKENPDNIKFRYNISASDLHVLLAKANIENLSNVQNPQSNIHKKAKSEGNWAAFKLFLDIVFGKAKDTASSVKSVEPGLSKDSAWAKKYLNYCKGKSELIRYLVEKDSEVAEENIAKEEYKKAAEIYRDITKPMLKILSSAVREAEIIVKEQRPQEAIILLEKKITEYEQWREKNTNAIGFQYRTPSYDIHLLLAKTKEAAGAPKKEVITAYKRSVSQLPNSISALLWLFENIPAKDYTAVVKECIRNSNVKPRNIYYIAKYFESAGNWASFTLFLDAMFSEVNPNLSYSKAIIEGLEENEMWSKSYLEFCRNRRELTDCFIEGHKNLAQKNMEQGNFSRAVEIYRDIVNQCGPSQDKATYELKVCECLFNGGEYQNAVSELARFIARNKTTHRALVVKAMMLKGQAYIRTRELDRAIETFFTLMMEYPEISEIPEVKFFVGYCYMLKGKFEAATETFNYILKDYPNSSYADKVQIYITRIKSMTE